MKHDWVCAYTGFKDVERGLLTAAVLGRMTPYGFACTNLFKNARSFLELSGYDD